MRIYVGNLAYATNAEELERIFGEYGEVRDAVVISDRDTGQSKGFGFVDMANDQEAQKAITSLDGTQVDGRSIKVNEARPQEQRRT
ncbi:MAG TPA: RNA-binding protein [Coriobacteriia bacterium]|jgi:RNA recognition motif-containing protein